MSQCVGGLESTTIGTIYTHKIGIAKSTGSLASTVFSAIPQVAPAESTENGGLPSLGALALKRQLNFLNRVHQWTLFQWRRRRGPLDLLLESLLSEEYMNRTLRRPYRRPGRSNCA